MVKSIEVVAIKPLLHVNTKVKVRLLKVIRFLLRLVEEPIPMG